LLLRLIRAIAISWYGALSPKRKLRAMSTLFAFLHHLCAFTLVSAVAIEFALIRQELTLASARRLQVTDLVLGSISKKARSIIFTAMLSWPSSRSSS
jgi:hypothetical protein